METFKTRLTKQLQELEEPLKILILEDSEADAYLLVRALSNTKIPFAHNIVWTKDAYVRQLEENMPDLIISDHSMPQFNSRDACKILRELDLDIPFILVTGTISELEVIKILEDGIDDYVLKHNLIRLPNVINNVMNKKHLEIEKQKIEVLNEGLNLAYHDIYQSVSYAQKIQQALLPSHEPMHELVHESFVIYLPRNVVSGDFYWIHDEAGFTLTVCGDCTGHGVPGAHLSMLGMSYLDQIVKAQGISEPSDILNMLKNLFSSAIGNSVSDGMEVSICKFDKHTNEIRLGLAMHSALVLSENGLNHVRGDKIPIGGGVTEGFFQTHTLKCTNDLRVYLFSDGYADQFGGASIYKEKPLGKKFQLRRMKELIWDTSALSMQEQGNELEKELIKWRGDLDQVDDITVIGLRFSVQV